MLILSAVWQNVQKEIGQQVRTHTTELEEQERLMKENKERLKRNIKREATHLCPSLCPSLCRVVGCLIGASWQEQILKNYE